MKFEKLDLNLLVALDALLTERNVSVAAERVHLSQSAMSGALNRLREFFKDELLINIGRRMVLTPRAESLAEPVAEMLLQVKTMITTPPEFDPTTSDRRFSVIASDYVADVLLAGALRHIHAVAPGVSIEMLLPDDTLTERLERGEIDLLINLEPYLAPFHPREVLFEDDFVLVAWAENDLVGDAVSFDQFFELTHVAVQHGRNRHPAFEQWFLERFGRTRRVEVFSPSFSLVPQLVLGTRRIATMHRRHAEHYARFLPLRLLSSPLDIPMVREMVQWHKFKRRDPGVQWLQRTLRDHAATLSQPAPAASMGKG
ncbi:LysR family transcriptional regulator [Nitrospirillum iridis]|uniref:DNA-binding transcriptional LysR family regulator n=1 Tax=Nitrospirillum iridis TaxID=765888 RepID=A0A7X0ECC4_9PROT|nr:LysR family transcriptional regulator [Nitrospirillum iridis]MBB6250980.1 DNA-binding transcriptional LysR family regulator [Nitrospirillum iridis]